MNYSRHFDSPQDFVAAANKPANKNLNDEQIARNSRRKFNGGTLKQATKMANEGWQDAPALSDNSFRQLANGETEGIKQMTQASVSGAFLEMGDYVAGIPECFQEFAPMPAPRGFRIGANMSAHAGISKRQKALRGAVILAVTDTLEKSGFTVDIKGFFKSSGSGDAEMVTSFPLKRSGERVDENQLAYWLCHDSALRQIYFSYQDTHDDNFIETYQVTHGRGKPANATCDEIDVDFAFTSNMNPSNDSQALELYKQVMTRIEKKLAS